MPERHEQTRHEETAPPANGAEGLARAAGDAAARSDLASAVRAGSGVEPRILAAWREWLSALATDAEAAIAAAHVYTELTPEVRDAWLDALAEDGPDLAVPRIAVYAPLLSVESDPARRARMEEAMALEGASRALAPPRALRGIADDGARVVALIRPLYLSFIQVLSCRYQGDSGFVWVHLDPIVRDSAAPSEGARLEGVVLEQTPLKPVVEELAHAILAHRRRRGELPGPLRLFADLFDAQPDADSLR